MRVSVVVGLFGLLLTGVGCAGPEGRLRKALARGTGTVEFPAGEVVLNDELVVAPGAQDLEIVGAAGGSVLRAGPRFQGRALLVIEKAKRVRLRNFVIEGNRGAMEEAVEIPAANIPLARHYRRNGILVEDCEDVAITGVEVREVAGFAVLVNHGRQVKLEGITVQESGGTRANGRNNHTGGIVFEEASRDFEVRRSAVKKVRGNGIWTRATDFSRRNERLVLAENQIEMIGRRAIEIGHANRARVENNQIRFVGFPLAVVDPDPDRPPAAIATRERVDESAFVGNTAMEVNGICFDLDGFHDSEVISNRCINRGERGEYPQGGFALILGNRFREAEIQAVTIRGNVFDGFRWGALVLIGSNHKVVDNRFRNLNREHCNEGWNDLPCAVQENDPNRTRAGIYLAFGGARPAPARNIEVANNEIHGFGMKANCVLTAPNIPASQNRIGKNTCVNSE
jgi:hypothetical protein